jgi:hypothetical protein
LFPDKTKLTGFSGVFGQYETWKPDSAETTRAQAAHLEEYKRILDTQTLPSLPSSSVPGILPFDPFRPLNSTSPTFGLPKSSEPTPVVPFATGRDSLNPLPAAGGLAARPFELPDVSAKVPALTPSTPLPEPTRTLTPTTDFNIPKRRFN